MKQHHWTSVRSWAAAGMWLCGVLPMSAELHGQVLRSTASPLQPFVWEGAGKASRSAMTPGDAARFITLYAAAYLGAPGALDQTAHADGSANGHHFPTVQLVFSAAARLQPGGGEARVARDLRRLNAHIRVHALDEQSNVLTERHAVQVLDIQPNTRQHRAAVQDSSTVRGAAVNAVSRTLVEDLITQAGRRVGPMLLEFKKIFHHPSAATQVSYLSEDSEFGWTWYAEPDSTLEGLHHAAAIFEVTPAVRSLRIVIDLVADWDHHGTWIRTFESIIDLGPTTGAVNQADNGTPPHDSAPGTGSGPVP